MYRWLVACGLFLVSAGAASAAVCPSGQGLVTDTFTTSAPSGALVTGGSTSLPVDANGYMAFCIEAPGTLSTYKFTLTDLTNPVALHGLVYYQVRITTNEALPGVTETLTSNGSGSNVSSFTDSFIGDTTYYLTAVNLVQANNSTTYLGNTVSPNYLGQDHFTLAPQFLNAVPVPEPASIGLLGLAAGALAGLRRRRR